MFLPKSSSGDEDHPQVAQVQGGGVDDHPHQGHQVDGQRRLSARPPGGHWCYSQL